MEGILLINKEKGKTSRDMVNELTHLFHTKKIGHTGTLDPIATGILVALIGKYTKLNNIISSIKKEYVATIKIGIKTDTLDITGNVIEKNDNIPKREDVVKTINNLKGNHIQQIPLYSAKKINGKKLYEYARKGEDVVLPKNEIEIYESEFVDFDKDEITFRVVVSKGTYIRSLIQDICKNLSIIGTMSDLIRTKQGSFDIKDSYTISDIKNNNYKILKAKDVLLYPTYILNEEEYFKVSNGSKITLDCKESHIILIYDNKEVAIYKQDGQYFKPEIMLI